MSRPQDKEIIIAAAHAHAQIAAAQEMLAEAMRSLSSFPDKPHIVTIVRSSIVRAQEHAALALLHASSFLARLP